MTNQGPLDKWTPVHIILAGAMGVLHIPRPLAYVLIFAVELVEFTASKFVDFFRESRVNIAADLALGIASYEVARLLTS